MDNTGRTEPPTVDPGVLHMRLASHERELAALNAERAQLINKLEALRAERQVLQAVAHKVATNRRQSSGGEQQV
jgi:uncharacterized protein (DUF3084 family)